MNFCKLIAALAAMITLWGALAGCGGSSTDKSNPFAGAKSAQLWIGQSKVGLLGLTIADDGAITGQVTQAGTDLPANSTINGRVRGDGKVNVSIGKYQLSGTMTIDPQTRGGGTNYTSGVLTQTGEDNNQTYQLDWWDATN